MPNRACIDFTVPGINIPSLNKQHETYVTPILLKRIKKVLMISETIHNIHMIRYIMKTILYLQVCDIRNNNIVLTIFHNSLPFT